MGRREKTTEDSRKHQEEVHMSEKSPRRRYQKSESASDLSSEEEGGHIPILERHSCTDIICSLIFLIFISLLVAISVFAYANGKTILLNN